MKWSNNEISVWPRSLSSVCHCATWRRDGRTREAGGRVKSIALPAQVAACSLAAVGSSAVLRLHHKDYCNTVQMGPCCNRLGRVDWTTGRGWRGGVGVTKVRWWMASLTLRIKHQSWPWTLKSQCSKAKLNIYMFKPIETSQLPVSKPSIFYLHDLQLKTRFSQSIFI